MLGRVQKLNSNEGTSLWLLPPTMQRRAVGVLPDWMIWSFQLIFRGDSTTDKVDEEIVNQGNSCCLYVPFLSESGLTSSFPVISGVEEPSARREFKQILLSFLFPEV